MATSELSSTLHMHECLRSHLFHDPQHVYCANYTTLQALPTKDLALCEIHRTLHTLIREQRCPPPEDPILLLYTLIVKEQFPTHPNVRAFCAVLPTLILN